MNKNKQYIVSYLKNGIILSVGIFLIYSLSKNILDYQKKIAFYEDYRKDLRREQEKNKQLKSDMIKSHDYYTVEKNIRQQLNLLKSDEIALIIPHPTPTPSPSPTPHLSIPSQWWELFFKNDDD